MDLENLHPSLHVRHSQFDLPVEPSRPAKSHIQSLGAVGGPDNNHILSLFQAVHKGEKLRHHPSLHLSRDLAPLGGDGVKLVEEDDGRSILFRLLEQVAEGLLALAVILGHDLRAIDADEVGIALIGHGLGQHGLARAGRAVQQDPFRGINAQPVKEFRMLEGQLDHLSDLGNHRLETAYILVDHRGHRALRALHRLGQ